MNGFPLKNLVIHSHISAAPPYGPVYILTPTLPSHTYLDEPRVHTLVEFAEPCHKTDMALRNALVRVRAAETEGDLCEGPWSVGLVCGLNMMRKYGKGKWVYRAAEAKGDAKGIHHGCINSLKVKRKKKKKERDAS